MMRVRIGEFVAAVCVVAWGGRPGVGGPWRDRCFVLLCVGFLLVVV